MKRVLTCIIGVLISISFICGIFASGEYDQSVIITKNPTSESISIGGKTWFIAHAKNATGMNWELVDPDGGVHTLDDAMAMNPGLNLQALEGDTIAVSNVPASVNGWGVQASFYNQNGSTSTSPAYIYVGDFLNAYSSVIEKYRLATPANIVTFEAAAEYNVSNYICNYDQVGYALKDLDKNGIPELLIAGFTPKRDFASYATPILFEVHTLINGKPIQILTSAITGEGNQRYNLTRSNLIYYEGFNGNIGHLFEFFRLDGDHLVFMEGTRVTNDIDNTGSSLYHSSVWNGKNLESLMHGEYDHPDYTNLNFTGPNDNKNLIALYEEYRSQCWIPQLTAIS